MERGLKAVERVCLADVIDILIVQWGEESGEGQKFIIGPLF